MPDDEEVLQHTEDAGHQAVNRTEDLLDKIAQTMDHMSNHLLTLTDHVASLEAQKAAEDVPATVREGVNDGLDTAGAAGGVVSKSVDVPLAVTEDVVHDTGETVKDAAAVTRRAGKFKRRR